MADKARIRVFIDLENIGLPFRARRSFGNKVRSLLRGIRHHFGENGYFVESIWGCAIGRTRRLQIQQMMNAAFAESNATMFWSERGIADFDIRKELNKVLEANPRPSSVLLVSGDNDFAITLQRLRQTGVEVLVAETPRMGTELRKVASKLIPFDLIS
jgi:NYN domain